MATEPLTRPQVIECFHLTFLNVLIQLGLGRDSYVLKGGANLRYYFKSFRYSEDIDFDVALGDKERLKARVNGAMRGDTLRRLLRPYGIEIANINDTAQNGEASQKWKLLLRAPGQKTTISTKVEFSRRNGETRFELEPVDEDVTKPYNLLRPSLQHYLAAPAIEQKVAALALRTATQARDVFDLNLLFGGYTDAVQPGAIDHALLDQAATNATELPYDAYVRQVVPFLDAEIVGVYGTREAWDQMQHTVMEKLFSLDEGN